MKKFKLLFLLSCSLINFLFLSAQDKNILYKLVEAEFNKAPTSKKMIIKNIFSENNQKLKTNKKINLTDYTLLNLNQDVSNSIIKEHPQILSIELPGINNETITVDLINSSDIFTNTVISTSNGQNFSMKNLNAAFYRGVIRGNGNSLVALNFFNGEVSGVISSSKGDLSLGKAAAQSEDHILIKSNSLKPDTPFICDTKIIPSNGEESGIIHKEITSPDSLPNISNAAVINKDVRIYYETEYDIYQNKGSIANVTQYITGLHNQVSTLYLNEGIKTPLSEIKIWNTEDPYTATNTSDLLTQFGNYRTSINGDLGQILTFRSVGGGIAWINGLCNPNTRYKLSASGISSTYSNIPTYSWSVNVVTHELGHLFGSPHTHDCAWNGNNTPIDGCGPAAGYTTACTQGPIPANGGTIMSYCHLVNVGINLSLGFGPQPGDLIRSRVTNATCLQGGSVCNAPATLTTSNISNTGATLSWTTVAGAQSYTVEYKTNVATTWTTLVTTTATSYNLAGLTANTAYNWRIKTNCSASSSSAYAQANFTTALACNAPTTLTTTNISNTGATLSWTTVAGAQSYTVEYKTNAAATWITLVTTTATSYNLTGLTANTAYNWRIKTNCSASSSSAYAQANFTTALACNTPTTLTTSNVSNSGATLSWTTVAGAQSYTVEYKTNAATIWTTLVTTTATSYNLTGLTANTAYNWRIKTNCSASNSSAYMQANFNTTAVTSCVNNYEPNETIATAYPISTNVIYNAGIGSTTDKDFYKFTLTGVNNVVITLQNLPKDYDLQLLNAAGSLIASSAYGGTTNETITYNNLAPGTYYVYVYGYGGAYDLNNCYALKVATTAVCNTPASLITSNVSNNGATLSWTAVSGAQSYTVEYKTNAATIWTTLVTTTATSYNLTGLTANTAYNWRLKTNCSTSSSSAYMQANFNTTAVASCVNNYEPNETIATAYPISTNVIYNAGIGSTADKDFYKFTLTGVNNVVITLQNLPKDYDLQLLNAAGNIIAYSAYGGTTNETITYNNLAPGTYYAFVYGFGGAYDLNTCYALKVSTNTTGTSNTPTEPDTKESNKTSEIKISPNPNSGLFKVLLPSVSSGLIQVTDLAGSLVYSQLFKDVAELNVNIQKQPSGVYIVKVQTQDQTTTKKVIKE